MLSKGLNLVKNNFEELPNNIEAEINIKVIAAETIQ